MGFCREYELKVQDKFNRIKWKNIKVKKRPNEIKKSKVRTQQLKID